MSEKKYEAKYDGSKSEFASLYHGNTLIAFYTHQDKKQIAWTLKELNRIAASLNVLDEVREFLEDWYDSEDHRLELLNKLDELEAGDGTK